MNKQTLREMAPAKWQMPRSLSSKLCLSLKIQTAIGMLLLRLVQHRAAPTVNPLWNKHCSLQSFFRLVITTSRWVGRNVNNQHDSYKWIIMLKKFGRPGLSFSSHMNKWHQWQLKKSKYRGPFWSYQLNSSANPAHLPQKWARWAELAVLFIW